MATLATIPGKLSVRVGDQEPIEIGDLQVEVVADGSQFGPTFRVSEKSVMAGLANSLRAAADQIETNYGLTEPVSA